MIRVDQTAILHADTAEEWERIKEIASAQADAGAVVLLTNATRTATVTSIIDNLTI